MRILITGVSSGIGHALAEDFVARGYEVYGSVRNDSDARRLEQDLGPGYTALRFDVTKADELAAGAKHLESLLNGEPLDALINNAGIVVGGPLIHLDLDDFRRQLEVNVTGVLATTQTFFRFLRRQSSTKESNGRVINMSAVSGRLVYPFLGPYAASKHALEALSDALRRELAFFGIPVCVIQPGTVTTPIWEKGEEVDLAPFEQTEYAPVLKVVKAKFMEKSRGGMPVSIVCQTVHRALTDRRPRTRYALPSRRWTGWILPRIMPDRWFDRIIQKRLGIDS